MVLKYTPTHFRRRGNCLLRIVNSCMILSLEDKFMCVVADTVQFPKTTVGGWEPTPCVEWGGKYWLVLILNYFESHYGWVLFSTVTGCWAEMEFVGVLPHVKYVARNCCDGPLKHSYSYKGPLKTRYIVRLVWTERKFKKWPCQIWSLHKYLLSRKKEIFLR